ncbi:type IV toxin-antitoxin system AbiEi family antitoxin [Desulfofustis limnaeus]|jgi:hypothetical protein|uniref:Transcriptional regulator, AbiEi antitoxin, Type IV TA system n=1 Tax=Desulfofustis limnaeus TaxID=2740163 RepID=A0ABN6M791_9BACT|nr:type IV toxin-antitoxin system AbiEi family antitoxin domain-containing protein [Desulfofustis limnaeus]BDD87681.1 hypothetical protein DPPLL_20460 [Desulfofustis limnaeus]
MQPIRYLTAQLRTFADENHYLFSLNDLRSLFPSLEHNACKALLARSVRSGLLMRVCQGVYLYPFVSYPKGLVLFHTAAKFRPQHFNYLSLETVLSDVGIISQMPTHWITVMSSGRSSVVRCGDFGTIEYIHTKKKPANLIGQLQYDSRCRLWRASPSLALRDLQTTKRNTDLVDWEVAREFIQQTGQ